MELTLDSVRDIQIYQRKSGYRFSLDALLLFDFVRQPQAADIVDLGAGSGIIGILLARRYKRSRVVLFELQESLFRLAERNIELNGLADRVRAVKGDIKEIKASGLPAGGFDLCVSNPPFRRPATGKLAIGEERAIARHEIGMRLDDLIHAAGYLLKNGGRFSMVYHPGRLPEVFERLRSERFEPKRVRFVHGRRGLPAKIALIESVKGGRPGVEVEPPLFVYEEDGSYTPDVRSIYEI